MHNVLRIVRRDIMRLLRVPTAWVIVVGLVVLPAFYAWVNIIGFWDPYGNTSNVRVSVANGDRGVSDDLLGDVDLGSQIVDSLHGNHDIGWTFVDTDTAMDDVRSGASYAAIIIPKNFSARLVRIIHGDLSAGRPRLKYLVNEKTSPIAPKVTDTAATTVDRQVNAAFVSAASEAVTRAVNRIDGETQDLASQTDDDIRTALTDAEDDIDAARRQIARFTDRDDAAIRQARKSLQSVSRLGDDAARTLTDASGLLTSTQSALTGFAGSVSGAMSDGDALFAKATGTATSSLSATASAVSTANSRLSDTLTALQDVTGRSETLADDLDRIAEQYPGDVGDAARDGAAGLRAANATTNDAIATMKTLNNGIGSTAKDAGALARKLGTASDNAMQATSDARTDVFTDTLPQLNGGLSTLATVSGTVGGQLASQRSLADQALLVVDHIDKALDQTDKALADTDTALADMQTRLATLRTDLDALSGAGTLSALFGGDGALDTDSIASFMLSPTVLDTKTLYPVDSYGSGMAPLFTNLAMWAGVFMLVALLRTDTDDEDVTAMTDTQAYMGRWLLFALLAALQGLTVTVGDLIIGVQTVNAAAFIVTGVAASVVYSAVAYMLATTLQHVGKALVIALIIVQIPGAGGLYPIEMMPRFFRALHPFFPFTYAIDALRETIGGFYGHTWLTAMLHLLLFAAIAFAIGLLVRPFTMNVNRLFARQIAETGILNGEPVTGRGHRYHLTQILQALNDRDDYRRAVARRAARFTELYPKLKRGALIVGFVVPAILTVAFSLTTGATLLMLGVWTIWVLLVIAFLLGIELVHDGIRRQLELGNLDDEAIREQLTARRRGHRRGREATA